MRLRKELLVAIIRLARQLDGDCLRVTERKEAKEGMDIKFGLHDVFCIKDLGQWAEGEIEKRVITKRKKERLASFIRKY